ncbi:acetyl-CoA acetyltransferase [Amycolatopsis sp. K13G38]|uniref:Acetyl-CoA acetyltransferase n=1 Tax=Amycolatopsis acididurans TaxID=2724524 RepID=A0ABX1J0I4_9PSEU|nr:acetyl-CoA acetyltransferase [Amycolatopsis acididurans]NKQ51781.1 acetyl-CoA acetyltransferase [Amycolatopsis acididurans]
MPHTGLDPRTPVIVGVGQFAERLDEPGYQRLSAVDIAARAARAAIGDTGAGEQAVVAAIDTMAGVRQFEISSPIATAPLGRSDNYPRSVARRIGAAPARAVLEVVGGQGPQHLVTEFAGAIADGRHEAVLLFGSEAMSTARKFAGAEDEPDFTEHVEGDLEDRGYGIDGMSTRQLVAHGLAEPPAQYALFDNARRARLKQTREEYAQAMGELFAPFTRVAAANPYAATPVERTAAELVTPTATNRLVVDPYTRYVMAREKVNQGASVLIMSVALARRLGVPEQKWVFLHGHADLRERGLMERQDLSRGPAAVMAAEHALKVAGIGLPDVATFDLYSCFPSPVFIVSEGLGLDPDDPRGLTVTGGLPFFGGPGNNYSMHAIAETVRRMRAAPGAFGFVGANGGCLSKYSAGVYSTTPVEWRPGSDAELQREIDSWPAVDQARHPGGWATIETYTVTRGADGTRTGLVIGRLEADGRRFVARTERGDDETLDLLTEGEPVGERVHVRSSGSGNRVAVRHKRLVRKRPALRAEYDHVRVHRDGHRLDVTITRPGANESLRPEANAELDEIFDAYFADPGLWVAIVTGAGERAFAAGHELGQVAGFRPDWLPVTGYAGLTSRGELPKPVIAAVEGDALGAGFDIALACHFLVAAETARFGYPEVRAGLVPTGGLARLPRTLPPNLANEVLLAGRRLSAAEAHAHGLVNRTAAPGRALETARQLADDLLQASPTAIRISLRLMTEPDPESAPALDDLMTTDDAFEGVNALARNRKPQWRNR